MDPERTRYLLDFNGFAFEREAGVSGNDQKPARTCQGCDDVLGYAVGKILLRALTTQVGKGQDGDRWLLGQVQVGRYSPAGLVGRGDETVTPSRHRGNKAGLGLAASKSLAQGRDVHLNGILLDRLPCPDAGHKLILGHQLPFCRGKHA